MSGDEINDAPAALGLDAFDTKGGAEEGAIMEVIGPSGETLRWPDGRPYTVTYYGADSKRFQKLILDQENRNNAAIFRTRTVTTAQVQARDILDQLVVATKCWDIPLANGEPAKNDPAEYREAYLKYRWLYDQGNAFVGTRSNFLKGAPKA